MTWPASVVDELTSARLSLERRRSGPSRGPRVLATICRTFPIYSQTSAHRELAHLAGNGFELRLLYSKRGKLRDLDREFEALWSAKRRDNLTSWSGGSALERYRRRMPERVVRLAGLVGEAAGLAPETLFEHKHFRQAFAFTRLVEAWGADYLHSYFFYERSLMTLVASYLLGIPRGITCYVDHLLKDYELKVVPLHLKLCEVVIATSERTKGEIRGIAPHLDPDRILLKPNAITAARFPAIDRSEPPPGEPFRILCVSRIDPKKGLLTALEAMSLLKRRGFSAQLQLVGDADDTDSSREYQRRLRRRLDELDLGGSVRLRGRQSLDGVRSSLEWADLFIAPFVELDDGDKDGIPTALLEAMATGLAVVVTDAGSMKEVVQDGREGLLVAQHDAPALAAAIEGLAADPVRRRRMGGAAARKIRLEFDAEAWEKKFCQRVKRILDATPAKPA